MSEENPRPIRIPKKRKGQSNSPRGKYSRNVDKPARVDKATQQAKSLQADQPQRPVAEPVSIATNLVREKFVESDAAVVPAQHATAGESAPAIQHKAAQEAQPWGGLTQSLWTMPAWALSLLVHVVVLLALALITAVVVERKPEVVISTSISATDDEPMEEFNEIEMEEPEELVLDEEPLFQPDMPEMPKLTFDEAAMVATETVVNGQPAEAAAATGNAALAADAAGSPKRGSETGKAITFYGSKAEGNRFVFLIDNSPNMNNEGRMLMAMDQLMRAVNQMNAKQSFYVVFYSNRAYPLFFPETVDDMIQATRKNKQKLDAWLRTVELCDSRQGGSQAIENTLQIAEDVAPSTIFFLTDGDYATKVASVLEEKSLAAPLNVIGLMPSKLNEKTRSKLELFAQIATQQNGTFSPVPANSNFPADTFIERRKTQPGPTWGIYE